MVFSEARHDARIAFNLMSSAAILSWIYNGGLERPTLANCAPWENNRNPELPILVDSYNFYSGRSYGYIAFMYQPVTRKWLLKSLKKNTNPDPRPHIMAAAFAKLSLLKPANE